MDFENAEAESVPDESGTLPAKKGTPAGGVGFVEAEGRGKVAHFQGLAEESVDFGDSLTVTGSITVEAWVRPQELAKWSTVVQRWDSHAGWLLGGGLASGAFEWWVDGHNISSNKVATVGAWHHVAATYDQVSGEMRLYINGRLADTTVGHEPGPIANPETSMALGTGGGIYTPFKGDLDDIRVWSVVLDSGTVCAHAGGAKALSGDCAVPGPAMGPVSEPSPALARMANRLAAARDTGEPVDLNDDGYNEYTCTTAEDGSYEVDMDVNQDQMVDMHEQWEATGNAYVWVDADADGFKETETTITAGPPRVAVTLRDMNLDAIYDLRVTRTWDSATSLIHTVVEEDPEQDGGFEFARESWKADAFAKSCCKCEPNCNATPPKPTGPEPKPCDGSDINLPTTEEGAAAEGNRMYRIGGVVVNYNDGPMDATGLNGSCSKSVYDSVMKAMDCATGKAAKCLSKTNTRMYNALANSVYKGFKVYCGNKCANDAAVALGYEDGSKRISLNPEAFKKMDAATQCETMLHEMLHVGDAQSGACHDCGDDEIYACGRFCAGCLGGGPKGTSPSSDCTTCQDTMEKKTSTCGSKTKLEPVTGSDWGVGLCHGTIGTILPCDQVMGLVTYDCADNKLSSAVVCCQACPSDAPQNDYPCTGVVPPNPDTCGQKPAACGQM